MDLCVDLCVDSFVEMCFDFLRCGFVCGMCGYLNIWIFAMCGCVEGWICGYV